MPKVSVIVPAHNSERFLRQCLNSLVNQTLSEIEILVINDHSTDKTKTIAAYYEKMYPTKVKALDLLNGFGAGTARNYGMKMAQGEKIGFVDSDDIVSTTMFEYLAKQMDETNTELAQTNILRITEKEYTSLQKRYVSHSNLQHPRIINYVQDPLEFHSTSIACWNKLYTRQLLDNITFPENCTLEDLGFAKLALLKSKTALDTNRFDYLYRKNASSVMALLIDELKVRLVRNLLLVYNWNAPDKDTEYILSRLYAIYQFYFPNLFTIHDEYTYESQLHTSSEMLQRFITPLEQVDIQTEKENVVNRIQKLERIVPWQK